jgi:hypothetical protein
MVADRQIVRDWPEVKFPTQAMRRMVLVPMVHPTIPVGGAVSGPQPASIGSIDVHPKAFFKSAFFDKLGGHRKSSFRCRRPGLFAQSRGLIMSPLFYHFCHDSVVSDGDG